MDFNVKRLAADAGTLFSRAVQVSEDSDSLWRCVKFLFWFYFNTFILNTGILDVKALLVLDLQCCISVSFLLLFYLIQGLSFSLVL